MSSSFTSSSEQGEGYRIDWSLDKQQQTVAAALHLETPADETFLQELSARHEVINPITSSPDNLRFLFGCNRAYGKAVLAAIDECVTRLKARQAYQPPVHDRRWQMKESDRSIPDFFLYLFPFNQDVVDQLNANPAIDKVVVCDESEGRVNILLHRAFSRKEILPQIEEVLNVFAGENPGSEPDEES